MNMKFLLILNFIVHIIMVMLYYGDCIRFGSVAGISWYIILPLIAGIIVFVLKNKEKMKFSAENMSAKVIWKRFLSKLAVAVIYIAPFALFYKIWQYLLINRVENAFRDMIAGLPAFLHGFICNADMAIYACIFILTYALLELVFIPEK